MVIKQQTILSNDIQENPGPFFEKCYEIVAEFCNDKDNEDYFYLRACVDQLTVNQIQVNPIPFPDDFLTDDKVDIWRKCELKIRRNQHFDNEFRKSLQNIWQFWFKALYRKELDHSVNTNQHSTKPGNNETSPVSQARNEEMSILSIPLKNKEKKHCGFYKYGRSVDGSKMFCLEDKCKSTKVKTIGVSRETLISHARKLHLADINFQNKTATIIRDGIRCTSCSKSLSRKQTLRDHQKKYHPDLLTSPRKYENQIQESASISKSTKIEIPTIEAPEIVYPSSSSSTAVSQPLCSDSTADQHQGPGDLLVLPQTLQTPSSVFYMTNVDMQDFESIEIDDIDINDFLNQC